MQYVCSACKWQAINKSRMKKHQIYELAYLKCQLGNPGLTVKRKRNNWLFLPSYGVRHVARRHIRMSRTFSRRNKKNTQGGLDSDFPGALILCIWSCLLPTTRRKGELEPPPSNWRNFSYTEHVGRQTSQYQPASMYRRPVQCHRFIWQLWRTFHVLHLHLDT